ncbi:hypothetical protein [Chryseobacterium sp. c4a]|uniref:hypothetical protein n=1 Tax=Chryseobacterium sp. c4a TaxID=1573582 RepID=UPI001E35446F|nr:hypothetical protein [Chryseobacterium sp. c4a]
MKTLKYLIILGLLVSSLKSLKAQNYTPIINYNFNGTPSNGIKIKTNIPFVHSWGMPTIIIEGYNYADSTSIGLIMNWYVYDNQFINYGISSFGGYTPEVKLSQENGKVIIFINDKKYYNRFTARAFAIDKGEDSSWFSDWSITDESLSGTNTVTVPYKNTVGELRFPGGIITNSGLIGIGTTNPQSKLEIYGGGDLTLKGATADAGDLIFQQNTGKQNARIWSDDNGGLNFSGSDNNPKISLINNGNVGIGISNPQNKLDVNGTIHAKEVKVDMSGWADFVFQKDYQLPTLDEVEKYINEKGHLPNIPNAKEVTENGLSLGENQKRLLQKIEELTLYQIQLNKEVRNLRQENRLLKETMRKNKHRP